ncbi:MAG: type 1 glutamine amidotransferase [Geminocystis sp.]|nr:type 1 glutamine amidotransferase [Geminocystis sp.]MCS7148335.1 type 1 glutamine amidotransferase [Geminocystis sp.]MCX8078351.1 type 1 glutamine amidotransferase [Geminocystis sp.]MDW8116077.1 type 1 glutamine amidotransferase [Geminocystis sp.]
MTIRIHYLQHVPFEGLGYIETWAKENNYRLTATRFYENDSLPGMSSFDWLVVLGGPMGVYDENKYPWLKKEKQWLKTAIDNGKTIIGICLGAQLIAEVLGGRVFANRKKEIGWFAVKVTEAGKKTEILRDIPSCLMAFHWHGDTFDIPENAIHLMKTEVCPNQAFLYKERVLALQFHLEVTEETIYQLINHCGGELMVDDYIQKAEEIVAQKHLIRQCNGNLKKILDFLAKT